MLYFYVLIINIFVKVMIRYYFLIASQDFFLCQEPIEEILRERLRHYSVIKKEVDFGLTTNLSFLDSPDLIEIKKDLIKPSAAIISLNPKFINWLKLRVHYAIKGSFISSPIKISNSLTSIEDINIL